MEAFGSVGYIYMCVSDETTGFRIVLVRHGYSMFEHDSTIFVAFTVVVLKGYST